MKELRKLTILFSIIIMMSSLGAFAQGKAKVYTTWDDNYFYASFFVDDPDVCGTSKALNSSPWDDDAVELFFETDNSHSVGRSKNTYQMSVSAAGGSAFTVGSESGKWDRKNIVTFKYAPRVDGSVNNSEDLDTGYTVEIALPWFEMGVPAPTPGTMMSFNIVIRMKGETDKFVSLSPNVKTIEDIQDASKWANIVFTAASFGASTLSLDKIVSAKYITKMPLIDGQIRPKEWNDHTAFSLDLPFDAQLLKRNQFQKTILTHYYYWYQANPKKSVTVANVRNEDGSCSLTDKPIRSLGPWFTFDRVQTHKDEFSDIRRAGIDIILPVYRGDSADQANYSLKGLDCMVEALRELKAEKKPYPVIGMFFDTSSMETAYGASPNLKDDEVKRTFYGMIKNFFMRVPEEFRAQAQVSDERSKRPCYIVNLSSSIAFSDFDSSFISYVNENFAKDFNANILWIGDNLYRWKAPVFDGYCTYTAGQDYNYDDTAKIRIASIGPGYDDCAVTGKETPITSRFSEETYRTDWNKALTSHPNWVFLDDWNQLQTGSELCGSKQYGFAYVDLTAMQSLKFRGARDYEAKYLRNNLPLVIAPDKMYLVDVMVQNDGMKPWKAAEGYALAYRWYQDGRPIGECDLKRPIQSDVLPNRAIDIPVVISALVDGGKALPEGNYEIRLEMYRLSDGKWFSALGDEGIIIPIKIGSPVENLATFSVTDAPVMVKSGATYTYKLKVRNDGSSTWKTGVAAVGAKLFKTSTYVHGGANDLSEEVSVSPISVKFDKDVAPGDTAGVSIPVSLVDANGQPLPTWKPSDQWSYVLKFDVNDGNKWLSESGSRTCDRVIDIFDADYGTNIIACDLPNVIDAGKTYDAKLVIRNNGTDAWEAGKYSIGCHWYYLDGTELLWDGNKTALKAAIRPGEPSIINAKVTAPAYDGQYILVWDLYDGNKWVSTADISRGGDVLISEITVLNGKLVFADLSKLFDVTAFSYDRGRAMADFDGQKCSFPAELMPPDSGASRPNPLYPCGYFGKVQDTDAPSSKTISFMYPDKSENAKNAILCAGQGVIFPKGKYAKIHVLGAAIEPNQKAGFKLKYTGTEVPAELTMSSWLEAPANGEEVAFTALHKHTADGDERGANCSLFHYTINVDPTKPLEGIMLPTNDKIRIVAITVEKP